MGPLNPWSRRNSVLYGVRMKLSVLLLICLQGISYGIPILGDNLQFDILQRFPQLQRYHANIQKPTDDFDGLLHSPRGACRILDLFSRRKAFILPVFCWAVSAIRQSVMRIDDTSSSARKFNLVLIRVNDLLRLSHGLIRVISRSIPQASF